MSAAFADRLSDSSWCKILAAALRTARYEVISLFFKEGSDAASGRFQLLRVTQDHVIVAIPKTDIDQVLTKDVNLNRH